MNKENGTLELARLYERQGYYQEALEIYLRLHSQKTGTEIQAGIQRMNKKIEDAGFRSEERVFFLFEKWLMLMVLRHRLDNFIKIRKRLF